MHRNTYILVTILAIFAALVVGVNLGRSLSSQSKKISAPTPTPTVVTIQKPTHKTYANTLCGFTFSYPDTLTAMEDASGSAVFLDENSSTRSVAVACQYDIPRPSLSTDQIETHLLTNVAKTASISAKLYHDSSQKDGSPIDAIFFRNPKNGRDIFIAGFGEIYDQIISTIKLL
jgi:hypothetical protein